MKTKYEVSVTDKAFSEEVEVGADGVVAVEDGALVFREGTQVVRLFAAGYWQSLQRASSETAGSA